jgi:hypothetical protein
MSSFDTTDVETIRELMAAAIKTIVPRYLPQQGTRYTWTKDQEVAGTLRNFDLLFDAERDSPKSWHGGGIALVSTCEIRISYPVGEADAPRFRGADYQDLAGLMVRLHTMIPGMFAQSMREDSPTFADDVIGQTGAYVGSLFVDLHFFASDAVDLTG